MALVIRNEGGFLKAYYNDSFGTKMDHSLPKLRQILTDNKVHAIEDLHKKQQSNGYDCGPWSVLNMVELARGGMLPAFDSTKASQVAIKTQRELATTLYLAQQDLEVDDVLDTGIDFPEESTASSSKSESASTDGVDELSAQTAKMNLTPGDKPNFVISTIAYVTPRKYEEDSSDEECDEQFDKLMALKYWPYSARKQTHKKTIDFKDCKVPADDSKKA
ncbi:MAG UNVERIFIED_CONTAM: hypothetical protein LVQ98_08260 [Rickettsiaceae bacterium]